ncbi:hypothetical protein [Chromobacterium amazonense]|uniref:hypothetical protein n=1 Tax=Chromobacterium amazonense TaxID=1382803 RepID=UPI001FD1B526|nr:hypothetical protein [Chromobacterium amazonense]
MSGELLMPEDRPMLKSASRIGRDKDSAKYLELSIEDDAAGALSKDELTRLQKMFNLSREERDQILRVLRPMARKPSARWRRYADAVLSQKCVRRLITCASSSLR